MRILILNWRDVRSPRAGGAEVVTFEIARRLAARGDDVVWFASSYEQAPARETIEGVRIVRGGSELTCRVHAARFARREAFDVVVEEINTVPFLAPLWAAAPVLLFIHQLAHEVWWYEAPRAVAALGYALEGRVLALYRDVNAVTVSRSTAVDLRALGFRSRIDVVPQGLTARPLEDLSPKRPTGKLVVLGRLVPSKRVDHAIEAVALLKNRWPKAGLTVIGDGEAASGLRRLAEGLGIAEDVRFTGRVGDGAKAQLLADADLILGCSVREGWGLAVSEAAGVGTPAVAYDVPGFRDSVVPGRTGLLVEQSPQAIACAVAELLRDPDRYARLRHAAWSRARDLSWDRTADAFARALAATRRR